MEYEVDGVPQPAVTLSSSPHTLMTAPAPVGTYHLTKVTVSGCEITLDEIITIDKITPPVFDAKLVKYGEDLCMGIGSGIKLEFSSNVTGPYVVKYEKDGVLQPDELVESNPFTLIVAPALQGTYRLINVFVAGCDIALDQTLIIDNQATLPVVTAQLGKYGEDLCLGMGAGLEVELTSNVSGPFLVEYEIDGLPQPAVSMDTSPYTLITAPAPLGIYHLTKISAQGCDFTLNETVSIDKNTVPPLNDIKWVLYGEDPLLGIGPGLQLEFTSTAGGPYIVEYEKDGVLQPSVSMDSSPFTLIAAPAPPGRYSLKKITFSGCDFQLSETAIIGTGESPYIRAQLVSYGEIPCVNGPGVGIQIASNITGPYVIEYEINGFQESSLVEGNNFSIIRPVPAMAGNYRLTKISKGDFVFYFDHKLLINNIPLPPKAVIEGELMICEGFGTILKAATDPPDAVVDSYQWVKDNTNILGANEKTLEADTDGDYLVRITDSNGCDSVSPVVHVAVRTKEQCGEGTPEPIPSPDYPKFFTPNGDGFNDSWHFKNFTNMSNAEIDIFDRYGKFIAHLTQSSPGWDGTYNNQALYATDYWFVLTYEDKSYPGVKRNLKGHFSLKR
ncbi:hypothetical protein BSF42_44590 [Flavobacterium sp. ACN6]|nr:hypothetical protein BSF42_44590 [Flavobacterium sp. ACN6]